MPYAEYASHWAVEGRPPAYDTPDEDVYLPGRNVILLSKAAVYCAAAHLNRIVVYGHSIRLNERTNSAALANLRQVPRKAV